MKSLSRSLANAPDVLWERACSRRGHNIQQLCRLIHRIREQARSHICSCVRHERVSMRRAIVLAGSQTKNTARRRCLYQRMARRQSTAATRNAESLRT
ncbi:hypothetical protein C1X64_02910 [Pseudomonas sp. GW456-E7]|nr:hypothetical protein C1X64_02910 [Pseudomonas sp. GW456-E7]